MGWILLVARPHLAPGPYVVQAWYKSIPACALIWKGHIQSQQDNMITNVTKYTTVGSALQSHGLAKFVLGWLPYSHDAQFWRGERQGWRARGVALWRVYIQTHCSWYHLVVRLNHRVYAEAAECVTMHANCFLYFSLLLISRCSETIPSKRQGLLRHFHFKYDVCHVTFTVRGNKEQIACCLYITKVMLTLYL